MSRTGTLPFFFRPGRLLISLAALVTGLGALAADFNDTHIYNPTWPGHAKFHVGQTMSMAVLLCVSTLWHLWVLPHAAAPKVVATNFPRKREPDDRVKGLRDALRRQRINTAALLAALYWVTQMAAYVFPETTPFDHIPGRENRGPLFQFKLEVAMLTFVGVGWWLEQ